jgi:hypothetical protein
MMIHLDISVQVISVEELPERKRGNSTPMESAIYVTHRSVGLTTFWASSFFSSSSFIA